MKKRKQIILLIVLLVVLAGGVLYLSSDRLKESDPEEDIDNYFNQEDQAEETTEEIIFKEIYQMDNVEVDEFLNYIEQRSLSKEERLERIIEGRIGTPYELGCLGEASGRDPDPVFRLDVADCTVFVMTTAALLNASSYEEARGLMGAINYYPAGDISYENRLHFTTYRNKISPYFTDITREVAGDKAERKSVVLNQKREDGTRLIDIDFEEPIDIYYLPVASVSEELLGELPDYVGVAFLKEGDDQIGLDVRHEGIVVEGKYLIHASSTKGKVAKEDFREYLFNSSTFDGIIIFKFNLLD